MQMLSVEEILERAPNDAIEKVIDVPEWGGSVKIRTLSAQAFANMKSASLRPNGRGIPQTDIGAMELIQFANGVIEPKFSGDQVRTLQITSSTGFKRIIDALDELQGGTEKEMLRKAQETFQERDERREAPVHAGEGAGPDTSGTGGDA